jgi:alkylated DNA repair protein alkB family protein 6
MSAIDFAKMRKQMRAEMAAKRAAASTAAAAAPEPEPEPEREPEPEPEWAQQRHESAATRAAVAAAEVLRALQVDAIDLEQYRCCSRDESSPRDVYYIPGVLGESEEAALVAASAQQPWVQLRDRRLQCHGGTVLPEGTVAEPLPPHLQHLCTALQGAGIFGAARPPNHCLVNEYHVGEGIMPHRDGPLYEPTVAILSLRAPIVFDFWASAAAAADPEVAPARSLLLEPRSLLVFRGDAYADFHHAIAMRELPVPPVRYPLGRSAVSALYYPGAVSALPPGQHLDDSDWSAGCLRPVSCVRCLSRALLLSLSLLVLVRGQVEWTA